MNSQFKQPIIPHPPKTILHHFLSFYSLSIFTEVLLLSDSTGITFNKATRFFLMRAQALFLKEREKRDFWLSCYCQQQPLRLYDMCEVFQSRSLWSMTLPSAILPILAMLSQISYCCLHCPACLLFSKLSGCSAIQTPWVLLSRVIVWNLFYEFSHQC